MPFGLAWLAALLGAGLGALVPIGLSVRGRTSPLAWTSRLRRLAAGWLVVVLALGAGLVLLVGPPAAAVLAVSVPVTVDLAAWLMGMVEKRLSAPYVAKARQRLARVRPAVVAITGSYGKTSTKGYVAHLLAASRAVVASPASFNNRLGLSRAVNDGLVDGTEVFVAEMGTYGPGEIRELCALFPPDRRGDHDDRRGAPRADGQQRGDPRGEVGDHRAGPCRGAPGRRARSGGSRRSLPSRGQARRDVQRRRRAGGRRGGPRGRDARGWWAPTAPSRSSWATASRTA